MARITGETLALGLDGPFPLPQVELWRSPARPSLPLPRLELAAPAGADEALCLVVGGPSLCLAALVTGAERTARGVLVRHRLIHRTRLPAEAALGWLDEFFGAATPLRLESPYHLVRLRGLEPGEPVRFVREHEVAVTGRLQRVGRAVCLLPDEGHTDQPGPGLVTGWEPRSSLAVRIGTFAGTIPAAWGHDPARPGQPLALDVPELEPHVPAYRLADAAARALRARVGERVRAVGVVGGASGRELTPAFVCAGEAGELLFEDPNVGWGRRLSSAFLAPATPVAA